MHQVIRTLSRVADKYAPSRMLSFDLVHVFKTMQLMEEKKKISRSTLVRDLKLGEGSIKTLVKHLKMSGLIDTSNAGMWLTNKGRTMYSKLHLAIPSETHIQKCSIALGKFNYAILVKGLAESIGSGIEQRDEAIKMGAIGATTMVFNDDKFLMLDRNTDSLKRDPRIRTFLVEKLKPEDNDVIIIASAEDRKTAEMAAKSIALATISNHEKH